jgi:glycosyltransferase involved in cell wall biosynthesis
MKVLIFDTSSKMGAIGGAQRVAGNLFYELRKRGISTYYIGYRTDYIKNDWNAFFISAKSAQRGIKRSFEANRLGWVLDSIPSRIAYYSFYSLSGLNIENVEKWLSKVKPDVVLASSIQDYIVLKALKKHLGRAKLIYIEHANASGSYRSAFDYNIVGLTFGTGPFVGLEKARKRFFSFFDGVIALNRTQFMNASKYNRNVTIIHSSTLIDNVKIDQKKLVGFKKRLGIEKDGVVLYLGRLSEAQKNVSTLISAFRLLKSRKVKLLIVGEGKSRHLYEKMSLGDDRIMILGRVPEEDLAYYYSAADLYVLPSLWESFNATSIEAAYFGAGLLLSESSINEDIKEEFGSRLYLFNPLDAKQLRDKIEKFFTDKRLQKMLSSLSKEIADEYNKERQMDAYAEALRSLHESGVLPKPNLRSSASR